jgi:hypothetical protein
LKLKRLKIFLTRTKKKSASKKKYKKRTFLLSLIFLFCQSRTASAESLSTNQMNQLAHESIISNEFNNVKENIELDSNMQGTIFQLRRGDLTDELMKLIFIWHINNTFTQNQVENM